MNKPKMSVVIPTYNRKHILAVALSSICHQEFPSVDYEVIVVVDGSIDGTQELLRDANSACTLRVLEQKHLGTAAARNAGAYSARGELLLFLDDDIICNRKLLRQHLHAHSQVNDPAVIFGPVFVHAASLSTLPAYRIRQSLDKWFQQLPGNIDLDWRRTLQAGDANSSMPVSAFLEVGGFDEEFGPQCETAALSIQLWKAGLRIQYEPEAVSWQIYEKTSQVLLTESGWLRGVNEILLCDKHPDCRAYSPLARLGTDHGLKRLARATAVRSSICEPLLAALCSSAERLVHVPKVREGGVRVLNARVGIRMFKGAVHKAGSWNALNARFATRVTVLNYHRVGPFLPGTDLGLTISPQSFKRQLQWLVRCGYTPIRASEWIAWRTRAKGLPRKPIIFTFDDAYEDIVEHALPLLERRGFPACVFVVTGAIGRTNSWDDAWGSAPIDVMSAAQIKDWATKGIEFGSHSMSHSDLTGLQEEELALEIAGSGAALERLLGKYPSAFAYPYGSHNHIVRRHCANSGYEMAFTTDSGINNLTMDIYSLRRTMIKPGDTILDFVFRLRFGVSMRERVAALARRRHTIEAWNEEPQISRTG